MVTENPLHVVKPVGSVVVVRCPQILRRGSGESRGAARNGRGVFSRGRGVTGRGRAVVSGGQF